MDQDAPISTTKKKNVTFSRFLILFIVLMFLGVGVSGAIYYKRIQPVLAELSILKTEATEFRAMSQKQVMMKIKGSADWDDLLDGKIRGQYTHIRGKTGLAHQMMQGLNGGTLFLFPPDATDISEGPRVLLYFVEDAPPNPGSLIETEVWVSKIDPLKSVGTISPEQVAELEESTPKAILIAKPLRVLKQGPPLETED